MKKVFKMAYHQEWLIKDKYLRYWAHEVWWMLPLSLTVKKGYWNEFESFWERQNRLFLAAGDGGMCLCAHCFGEPW